MKPYHELTTTGRARRLRVMAWRMLADYDVQVARLRLLTNFYNAIFRVDTVGGARYVLRILRPGERTDAQILSQALWLTELGRRGVGVSYPIPNRVGDLVTRAEAPGVPEPRQGMLCAWVPGTSLGEHLSSANAEKQGALMARMHACAEQYTLPPDFAVKVYNRLMPYPEPWVVGDPAYLALVEEPVQARVQALLPQVEKALTRLLGSGQPMHLLHGDLHQWNVLLFKGQVYAIDFDDLLLGYPVQDIGISLYYYLLHPDAPALMAAFRRGYETLLPWPEQAMGEVATWIAARALNLLNTVLWSEDPDDRQFLGYCVDRIMVAGSAGA